MGAVSWGPPAPVRFSCYGLLKFKQNFFQNTLLKKKSQIISKYFQTQNVGVRPNTFINSLKNDQHHNNRLFSETASQQARNPSAD